MPVRAYSTSPLDKLFNLYLQELIEWNKKFNLTAVTDPDEIRIRHFEDSLSILKAIDLKDESVLDVGAGAGFPGIPLKIVRPKIKLTLIDSTRKKVEFLNHIIKVLNLDNTEAVWGRAENLSKDQKYREKFDVVVSRAVAKLPDLVKYCLPFLKPGGLFVAMKQENVKEELDQAKRNLKKLNGKIIDIIKVEVGDVPRSLVVIEKI